MKCCGKDVETPFCPGCGLSREDRKKTTVRKVLKEFRLARKTYETGREDALARFQECRTQLGNTEKRNVSLREALEGMDCQSCGGYGDYKCSVCKGTGRHPRAEAALKRIGYERPELYTAKTRLLEGLAETSKWITECGAVHSENDALQAENAKLRNELAAAIKPQPEANSQNLPVWKCDCGSNNHRAADMSCWLCRAPYPVEVTVMPDDARQPETNSEAQKE